MSKNMQKRIAKSVPSMWPLWLWWGCWSESVPENPSNSWQSFLSTNAPPNYSLNDCVLSILYFHPPVEFYKHLIKLVKRICEPAFLRTLSMLQLWCLITFRDYSDSSYLQKSKKHSITDFHTEAKSINNSQICNMSFFWPEHLKVILVVVMFDPLITASILVFSNAKQSNAKSIAASGSSKESHYNDVYI